MEIMVAAHTLKAFVAKMGPIAVPMQPNVMLPMGVV
jgi:hypothetical protein